MLTLTPPGYSGPDKMIPVDAVRMEGEEESWLPPSSRLIRAVSKQIADMRTELRMGVPAFTREDLRRSETSRCHNDASCRSRTNLPPRSAWRVGTSGMLVCCGLVYPLLCRRCDTTWYQVPHV